MHLDRHKGGHIYTEYDRQIQDPDPKMTWNLWAKCWSSNPSSTVEHFPRIQVEPPPRIRPTDPLACVDHLSAQTWNSSSSLRKVPCHLLTETIWLKTNSNFVATHVSKKTVNCSCLDFFCWIQKKICLSRWRNHMLRKIVLYGWRQQMWLVRCETHVLEKCKT